MSDTIPLSAEELTHIDAITREVEVAQLRLGQLRDNFLAQEGQVLTKLTQLQQERDALLSAFSRAHLKDLDGHWMYDDHVRGLVKQPGA